MQTEMQLSTKWKLKFNLWLHCGPVSLVCSSFYTAEYISPSISTLCLYLAFILSPSFAFFFFFRHPQTTKAFLPRMLELQHGHVVCINSILSQSPIPGAIDYCTSKASSLAFMESLTLGLLDCPGVGCTTVLPFHTNTEMFQGMRVRYVKVLYTFTSGAWSLGWQCCSLGQSVHQFHPDYSISTTIGSTVFPTGWIIQTVGIP